MPFNWKTKFNLLDAVKINFNRPVPHYANGKTGNIVRIQITETESGDDPETNYDLSYLVNLDGYEHDDPDRLLLVGEESLVLSKGKL